jgi:hypothetical protein
MDERDWVMGQLSGHEDILSVVLRTEGKLDGLRAELLGNGQPGRVQRNEERVEELDKRLTSLNVRMYWFFGCVVGFVFLLNIMEILKIPFSRLFEAVPFLTLHLLAR